MRNAGAGLRECAKHSINTGSLLEQRHLRDGVHRVGSFWNLRFPGKRNHAHVRSDIFGFRWPAIEDDRPRLIEPDIEARRWAAFGMKGRFFSARWEAMTLHTARRPGRVSTTLCAHANWLAN